jgi:D-alanyl-D-alanine carboxypeptidase
MGVSCTTGSAAPARTAPYSVTRPAVPTTEPGPATPSTLPVPTPPPPSPIATSTPVPAARDRRLLVVWTGGELSPAVVAAVRAVPGVTDVAPVGEGTLWLTGPHRALGASAAPGAEIPIDAASADPAALRRVLGDQSWLAALARGEAVISVTSAALRRSGRGDELQFAGGASFRIGAVATDRAVGAHEVFLPAADGPRLGMGSADYLLVRVARTADPAGTERAVERAVPTSTGHGVRVRSQAQTAYLRRADGVMPPEWTKVYFGEFAAHPTAGGIAIDPAWVRANIVTADVPILGHVTCNRSLIPPLRAALRTIQTAGDARLVDPAHYGGCFAERLIRGSASQISQHAYGAAIDINVSTNPLGATPTQDLRVIDAFHREGFVWGGDFLRQDGMHFEYGCPAVRDVPERTTGPEELAGLALCGGA